MPTTTGKKIAIVTGSALGLGYELASQLIANGWLVAGVDFNAERQAELTAQWPDDSYRAYVGDITDEAFVKESVADIATLGHIDLLINNAGQPSFKVPTAYEAADVDKCLKGLKGMILWTVETLKACGEQNVKIAQIMSTAATRGNANESVYCATKWGEKGYTKSLQAAYKAPVSRWSPSIRAALIPLSTVTVATTSPRPSSTPSCSPARWPKSSSST